MRQAGVSCVLAEVVILRQGVQLERCARRRTLDLFVLAPAPAGQPAPARFSVNVLKLNTPGLWMLFALRVPEAAFQGGA